ncbi:MAG: hypothetical protein ACOXZW_04215 [Bacilli bacterium]|jgi:hypothetical protein|nr:hypothetical protein [Bacilli bacterium]
MSSFIYYCYVGLRKGVSSVLIRIPFFDKYGDHYKKYMTKKDKKDTLPIDFISTKFLLGFFLLLIGYLFNLYYNLTMSVESGLVMFLIGYILLDISLEMKVRKTKTSK